MSSVVKTALVALLTFASSMMGFLVQWLIPAQHIADSRGAIGSVVGLVTLLLALVLGLLIWTSYGVFTTQQSEAQTLGSAIMQLDLALENYGPETVLGRIRLKEAVRRSRDRFWSTGKDGPANFGYAQSRSDMQNIEAFFHSLHPESDEQRQLLASGRQFATTIVQTNLLMSRQLDNPVPSLLLIVVLCWSTLLFLGFGLLANFTAITVAADALGAISVSSALFLILEFSAPYTGLFKIRSSGIDMVLTALIDEDAKG